jgi:hypothetical protein
MNSEKLQQLKDEMEQKTFEILNNSQIAQMLKSYDCVIGEPRIEVKFTIDLTKAQTDNGVEVQQAQNMIGQSATEEVMSIICCFTQNNRCIKC